MSDEKKELKTLEDIEKEFIDAGGDGNFLNCLYRCRESARKWHNEILKNFKENNTEEKYNLLITASKTNDITYYKELKDKYLYISEPNIIDVHSKLSWIRAFFNLEMEP